MNKLFRSQKSKKRNQFDNARTIRRPPPPIPNSSNVNPLRTTSMASIAIDTPQRASPKTIPRRKQQTSPAFSNQESNASSHASSGSFALHLNEFLSANTGDMDLVVEAMTIDEDQDTVCTSLNVFTPES